MILVYGGMCLLIFHEKIIFVYLICLSKTPCHQYPYEFSLKKMSENQHKFIRKIYEDTLIFLFFLIAHLLTLK